MCAPKDYIIDHSSQHLQRQWFVVREQRRLEQKAYYSTGCGLHWQAESNKTFSCHFYFEDCLSGLLTESLSQRLCWCLRLLDSLTAPCPFYPTGFINQFSWGLFWELLAKSYCVSCREAAV